jgi:hypothetical protein
MEDGQVHAAYMRDVASIFSVADRRATLSRATKRRATKRCATLSRATKRRAAATFGRVAVAAGPRASSAGRPLAESP